MRNGFVKMHIEGEQEVMAELRKLAKKAGLLGEDFADYSAKVVQQMVVRNVQPFGVGGKARKQGEAAVSAGVNNAFKPVQRMGKGVIGSVAEARAFHSGIRDNRGRVSKRAFKKRIYHPVFMAFLREQQAKVGKAKGSFAAESARLGNRVQSWVKRHVKQGDARRMKTRRGVVWEFSSDVDYTNKSNVMGRRGIQRVFRKRASVLKRSLEGRLRRMGKLDIPF